MNIDDVKTEDLQIPATKDIMQAIFDHQRNLAIKYIDIERRNGFWKPDLNIPLDQHIDNAQFQNWVKNMFWRTTEEIAEAWEAYSAETAGLEWKKNWHVDHVRHFVEELIDALHFFTEVSVFIGYPAQQAQEFIETGMRDDNTYVVEAMFDFIVTMGLSANCLKNKPWKSTHMGTDQLKFVDLIGKCWGCWGIICAVCNFSLEDLYRLYVQKHTVNTFRQNSQY